MGPWLQSHSERPVYKPKTQAGSLTIDRYNGQDEPGGPLRKVLDEDQSHESRDHDEVGLLQTERTLPVDTDHPYHAEVPDDHSQGDPVHRHVVRLEHFSGGRTRVRLLRLGVQRTEGGRVA